MTSNNIFILILLQQYPSCFVDAVLSESQPVSSLQYGYRSVLFLWNYAPESAAHSLHPRPLLSDRSQKNDGTYVGLCFFLCRPGLYIFSASSGWTAL